MEQPIVNTVICIPGKWKNREEFVISLIGATEGEYIAAGMIMLHTKQQRHFTFEFCDRDEQMQQSFHYAGAVTRVSDRFIDEIGGHTSVVYLSAPAGSPEQAADIAFAASAVLKAGGLGVKIETTGKAFEKDRWMTFIAEFEDSLLYEMYVVDSIVDADGTVYSCGMRNLGLKDTIVAGLDFQESVDLIRVFGYYQLMEKPVIRDRQTFSPEVDAPVFRITDEPRQPNEGHELFENPFGMWRLTEEG